MKVLIFGTTGKVATELAMVYAAAGHNVFATTKKSVNFQTPWVCEGAVSQIQPDLVINATAMNGMEQCDADAPSALLVNGVSPGAIAAECRRRSLPFVHYSTDYVFSGQADGLREDTPTDPSGTYGWSKRQGEEAVLRANPDAFVFRVSSIYGRRFEGPLGPVAQAIAGKGGPDDPIKVLHQFCAPTSARTIAAGTLAALTHAIGRGAPGGIYHLAACTGVWKVDFARDAVNRVLGPVGPSGRVWDVREGTLPVPRPIHTQLIVERFQDVFGHVLPTVEEDLLATLPLILEKEGRDKAVVG